MLVYSAQSVHAACQPFDRRDGALVVELEDLSREADTIDMTVRAAGRTFSERMTRPADDRITAFSAVPAGPAELDLRIFAGDRLLHERLAIGIEIVEGETITFPIQFEDGPAFAIDEPPEGAVYRRRGETGFPIDISVRNPELDITLEVLAEGRPIEMTPTGRGWSGFVPFDVAGDLLPAPVGLHVTACLASAPSECIEQDRSVVVTRHAWEVSLPSGSAARPAASADLGRIIVADALGAVAVYGAGDGVLVAGPFPSSPVFEDLAAAGDLAGVADDAGNLVLYDLALGIEVGRHPIGVTTAPVARGSDLYAGAEDEVFRIDRIGRSAVLTLPGRMRAPPLVDELGIAAADIFGNVVAVDASAVPVLLADAAASIFAAPVRYGDRLAIGTSDDRLILFEGAGSPREEIDLGAPIIFAPASLGGRLAVAAGDRVCFVDASGSASVRLEAPITGAPAVWSPDEVVVGLRNGWVVVVGVDRKRVMGVVRGAATSPLVVESLGPSRGRGVAVVGTGGDLAMLEPEDGF
jgi:hypothetical protein